MYSLKSNQPQKDILNSFLFNHKFLKKHQFILKNIKL